MSRTLRHLEAIRDRQLATAAADRVHKKLYASAPDQTPKEFVYCLPTRWMLDVFIALCSAHELIAFRDLGMRREKAITLAPPAFIRDRFEPDLYAALGDMHTAIVELTEQYIASHLLTSSSAAAMRRSYKGSGNRNARNFGATDFHG